MFRQKFTVVINLAEVAYVRAVTLPISPTVGMAMHLMVGERLLLFRIREIELYEYEERPGKWRQICLYLELDEIDSRMIRTPLKTLLAEDPLWKLP